jgi:ADP-ribose pyrophosphatase YjhB (NUDIX family)
LKEEFVHGAIRAVCPACSYVQFLDPKLVTIVVIEHQGKLLLGRRNIEPGRGKWSYFGGYVEQGEQVEEAALREVKEETNLDVHIDRFIGVYSERGDPHVLLAYAASVVNNDLSGMNAQLEETSELALFALDELPELAFAIDTQILHDMRAVT